MKRARPPEALGRTTVHPTGGMRALRRPDHHPADEAMAALKVNRMVNA